MNPVVHGRVYSLNDRLQLIAQRVDRSMRVPQKRPDGSEYMLRDLALEQVQGCPQDGQAKEACEIAAIFNFVSHNVEYRQDPTDYDLYMGAGHTLNAGGSDCDDHSILTAAMLSSIGYNVGCKVVGPNADGSGGLHIYTVVGVNPWYAPQQLIAVDTSMAHRGSYPGWEPPAEQRRFQAIGTFRGGRVEGLTQRN